MAMTKTASISSTIAKAIKNIFKLKGTRLPRAFKTAKEKAISVAIGIPQPLNVSGFWFKRMYKPTGINAPPIAPNNGKANFFMEFNSPIKISLLISNPIKKKKIDIKPSLIQSNNGFLSSKPSPEIPIL